MASDLWHQYLYVAVQAFQLQLTGKKVNGELSVKRLISSYLAHSFAISPMLLTSDHIYRGEWHLCRSVLIDRIAPPWPFL